VIDQKGERAAIRTDVHLQAVARKDGLANVFGVEAGTGGKEPACQCVVGVSPNLLHLHIQSPAQEQTNVDAAGVIAVQQDDAIERIVHEHVVEDAEGGQVFDFLNGEDVRG